MRIHKGGLLSRLLIGGVLTGVLAAQAWSCNDPNLHPELAEFRALVESLGEQPVVPLQVMYRVSPEALGSNKRSVALVFKANRDATYEDASFTVTASDGMDLLTPALDVQVNSHPTRLSVQTNRPGVHHLRIELAVRQDGEQRRRTILVPVMSDLNALHARAHGPSLPPISAQAADELAASR